MSKLMVWKEFQLFLAFLPTAHEGKFSEDVLKMVTVMEDWHRQIPGQLLCLKTTDQTLAYEDCHMPAFRQHCAAAWEHSPWKEKESQMYYMPWFSLRGESEVGSRPNTSEIHHVSFPFTYSPGCTSRFSCFAHARQDHHSPCSRISLYFLWAAYLSDNNSFFIWQTTSFQQWGSAF